jgi:hypothetical protein
MNLYYLPDDSRGFLVEVGIDEEQDCFVVLRSFTSAQPLEEYVCRVTAARGVNKKPHLKQMRPSEL